MRISEIKKILREPLFYLMLLLAVAYLIVTSVPFEILDVKMTRNNITENIKLPYKINMAADEVFYVSFNLSAKNKDLKFNMIPDDCLQELSVNGENILLDGIKGLCDYEKGMYFDFSKYIQEGLNHFELRIKNNGGPGGLRVEIPHRGFRDLSLKHYIFALFLLLSIALVLRKFKFGIAALFIISLGITVRLIAYTYIDTKPVPFDTRGHLHYMQIITEEKRLPKMNEGWSTYHPPLYYIITAAVKSVFNPQQWQLLLSFASVIFGVALMLNLFGNNRFAYLAAFISVLWPGFVFAALYINNDTLFYFGALFCMMFAQRYWYWHKDSDMLLASIGASIALAAKSNGFVILGVWAVIYIFNAVRSMKIGSLRILFASVLIVALFAGFSNYRIIMNVFEGKKIRLIENISALDDKLRVQNTASNYLYFDLQDYLLEPYTDTRNDKGGRQYFWNFALKTSLFGEFRLWDSPVGHVFATALSFLLLSVFVLALWGIIHAKIKELPPLLFTVFLFAALIYLRIKYPFSATSDFRFIFPVLFPLVYFSVRGVQILEDSRLRKLSYLSLFSFAALSFLFVIGMAV